jgi:hypothetical protein
MWLLVLKVHDALAARFFGQSTCERVLLPSNVYITNAALKRSPNGYLAHKR